MVPQPVLQEGYVPLYGSHPPCVVVVSDDAQVHRVVCETLNEYGFDTHCFLSAQFPSALETLTCRPKVLIVDTYMKFSALAMVAEVLEAHHHLKGCARLGLGDGDKRCNVGLHFHHRWCFPLAELDLLTMLTHLMQRHVADEATVDDARIVV
jgi:CheY-like chemotaxis protein